MDEWDKYQEEIKFKYPKVFENALKIQSLYPETDRGAALIVAAVLEEQLTLILYSFLRDSKSAKMLLESFETLNNKFGATILVVTHDAFTASYCKKIMFIQDGKIFKQINKGEDTRKKFFDKIIEVISELGGDTENVF